MAKKWKVWQVELGDGKHANAFRSENGDVEIKDSSCDMVRLSPKQINRLWMRFKKERKD